MTASTSPGHNVRIVGDPKRAFSAWVRCVCGFASRVAILDAPAEADRHMAEAADQD